MGTNKEMPSSQKEPTVIMIDDSDDENGENAASTSETDAALHNRPCQGDSSSDSKAKKKDFQHKKDEKPDGITTVEYENLTELLKDFSSVPTVSQHFCRPVVDSYPELRDEYERIISNPMDLDMVCSKVHRRQYQTTGQVQEDVWQIFENCIRFHSHPSNPYASPMFISVAKHLRGFFDSLWLEHMLPSDPPKEGYQKEYILRDEDRKRRSIAYSKASLSPQCMKIISERLTEFVSNRGRVDKLDKRAVFPDKRWNYVDEKDLRGLDVEEKLHDVCRRLRSMAEQNTREYNVECLSKDLLQCYNNSAQLEENASLRIRINNRVIRCVEKVLVLVHESICRGVTGSALWCSPESVIWARIDGKKAYWPALVLGVVGPDNAKKDYYKDLTDRNEARLPKSLKADLSAFKNKADQCSKEQPFYLVEFLGTHDYTWVKGMHILNNFDPDQDPYANAKAKRRSGRAGHAHANSAYLVGNKTLRKALAESRHLLKEIKEKQPFLSERARNVDGKRSISRLYKSDEDKALIKDFPPALCTGRPKELPKDEAAYDNAKEKSPAKNAQGENNLNSTVGDLVTMIVSARSLAGQLAAAVAEGRAPGELENAQIASVIAILVSLESLVACLKTDRPNKKRKISEKCTQRDNDVDDLVTLVTSSKPLAESLRGSVNRGKIPGPLEAANIASMCVFLNSMAELAPTLQPKV